jgi:hypothetical protein
MDNSPHEWLFERDGKGPTQTRSECDLTRMHFERDGKGPTRSQSVPDLTRMLFVESDEQHSHSSDVGEPSVGEILQPSGGSRAPEFQRGMIYLRKMHENDSSGSSTSSEHGTRMPSETYQEVQNNIKLDYKSFRQNYKQYCDKGGSSAKELQQKFLQKFQEVKDLLSLKETDPKTFKEHYLDRANDLKEMSDEMQYILESYIYADDVKK